MNIRLATSADAENIAQIHSDSWNFTYSNNVSSDVIEKYTSRFQAMWCKMLENNTDSHYVIEREGNIVGFLTLTPSRDDDLNESCEIVALYLSPEHIGKGFGRQAMDWAKEEVQRRGYGKISLWVLEKNLRARRFYEKSGFVSDGKTKPSGLGDTIEIRYVMNK